MSRLDKTRWLGLLALIATLPAVAAVRGQSSYQPPAAGSPPVWRIAAAPPELQVPIARADLIVAQMHDALIRELTIALERGGPDRALQSCHIDVIGLLQRLGRHEGIAAGRTGDRLRSPTNAPRPWAAPLVRAHAGGMARDIDGFAVDLGDKVGVLRPIAERSMCASCHGPVEKLSPAVRAALADRYPADQAIGFKEGEVRGWYWVEMPKGRR